MSVKGSRQACRFYLFPMCEIIKLNVDNCMSYAPIKPAVYSIAEPGACGSHGVIVVDGSDGRVFRLDYIYRSLSLVKIEELFPQIASTRLTLFGEDDVPSEGWIPVYLGLGNHLFIQSEFFPLFAEEAKTRGIRTRGELYQNWVDITRSVIQKDEVLDTMKQQGIDTVDSSERGENNFDLIEKNSHLMFEGHFSIIDLLKRQ